MYQALETQHFHGLKTTSHFSDYFSIPFRVHWFYRFFENMVMVVFISNSVDIIYFYRQHKKIILTLYALMMVVFSVSIFIQQHQPPKILPNLSSLKVETHMLSESPD